MKIVLDTNVLVSGLLWKGLPWQLLKLAEESKITLCVTPFTLEELEATLKYRKFQPRLQELRLSLEEIMAYVISIASLYAETISVEAVPADPDDNIFINCALSAGAVYIVSGDEHLLSLVNYKGIAIITARDFLEREFLD